MYPLVKLVGGLVLWAAAAYGVLLVGNLPSQWLNGHVICGPWGCGPTVSALVTWYGFCLVLAAPPVALAAWKLPEEWLRRIGLALFGAGILGITSVGVWEAVTWLPKVADGQPSYFVQRYLFSLITMVDVPLIPTTLAGAAVLVAAWVKKPASLAPVAIEEAPGSESQLAPTEG